MIFEALMTGILAWQVLMPSVDNSKYIFQIDRDGTIVRMNTQDGTMVRCNREFHCVDPTQKQEPKELDYKY